MWREVIIAPVFGGFLISTKNCGSAVDEPQLSIIPFSKGLSPQKHNLSLEYIEWNDETEECSEMVKVEKILIFHDKLLSHLRNWGASSLFSFVFRCNYHWFFLHKKVLPPPSPRQATERPAASWTAWLEWFTWTPCGLVLRAMKSPKVLP